jgi:hypothetical protein
VGAFVAGVAVWPFEAGWAPNAKWLPKRISVLHAEIYPSVREPKPDTIKDRGQVRAVWEWARDLDQQNLLWCEFCRPVDIEPGSKEDIAIQLTEGRCITDSQESLAQTTHPVHAEWKEGRRMPLIPERRTSVPINNKATKELH